MNFWQFAFFFLFVRNWHTGKLELSRSRLTLFAVGMFFIVFGFMLVSFMSTPLQYVSPAVEVTPTSTPVRAQSAELTVSIKICSKIDESVV